MFIIYTDDVIIYESLKCSPRASFDLEAEVMEIFSVTNLIHWLLFILNSVLSGKGSLIPLGK